MLHVDLGKADARLLTIPGLSCSGADHWQTLWEQRCEDCSRIELPDWDDPDPGAWIVAIDRAVTASIEPVLLVAHSLGCIAVAAWAQQARALAERHVQGALLVAPPDVDAVDADPRIARFAPAPSAPLPFRAIVVASRNDRYATIGRSRRLADRWAARFNDVGERGHINAASGLGEWPEGQSLAEQLLLGHL